MSMTLEMWATPLKEIPEKGRFQTPYAKDGLYYPEPHARKLWEGKKIMVVKKRRYPQYEHVGTHILGEYSYGILTLGPPENLPSDFVRKEFREEHLISDKEWRKWEFPQGEEKVWVYRPHVSRTWRHPYDYYFPKGTQVIVKDVRLIEPIKRITHPSGKGEEIKPVEESFLEALPSIIEEYFEKPWQDWFILEQKRAYPETPIEELTKRDFSLWVIQQHLIGEYGKKGERGLRRDNLLDLPIKKGKAHWDFRFQRINPKTGKALETLEYWDQEELEYFFIDELGRLRFVPETGAERREYADRVTLSRRHSREFTPEHREAIEERLRKYRAMDLRGVSIKDAPDDEYKMLFDVSEGLAQGGGWYERKTNTCYLNGRTPLGGKRERGTTLEHELAHSIWYQRVNPHEQITYKGKLRWYPKDDKLADSWFNDYQEVRPDLESHVSKYSGKSYAEGFAESLAFMKKYPATTSRLKKTNPKLKSWFERIEKETGYKIRKTRED